MPFPADWGFHKEVALANVPGTGAYPLAGQKSLIVHRGTGTDSGRDVYIDTAKLKSDFADLRMASDAGALIPYTVHVIDATKATVVFQPGDGATAVRVYYGNSVAVPGNTISALAGFHDAFNRIAGKPSYLWQGGNTDPAPSTQSYGQWDEIVYWNDFAFISGIRESSLPDGAEITIRKIHVPTGKEMQLASFGAKFDDNHNAASIAVSSTGTLHIAYGCHNTQLYYRKCTSGDLTTLSAEITVTGADDSTYPRVFVDPANEARVVILSREGDTAGLGVDHGLVLSRSSDTGTTWLTHQVIDFNLAANNEVQCIFQAAMHTDSTIHVVWARVDYAIGSNSPSAVSAAEYAKCANAFTASDRGIWTSADGLTQYTDGSASFETGESIGAASGQYPSHQGIAVDSTGKPVSVRQTNPLDENNGFWIDVDWAISRWNGSAWVQQTGITGQAQWLPFAYYDSADALHIVGIKDNAGSDQCMDIASSDHGNTFGTPTWLSTDFGGAIGSRPVKTTKNPSIQSHDRFIAWTDGALAPVTRLLDNGLGLAFPYTITGPSSETIGFLGEVALDYYRDLTDRRLTVSVQDYNESFRLAFRNKIAVCEDTALIRFGLKNSAGPGSSRDHCAQFVLYGNNGVDKYVRGDVVIGGSVTATSTNFVFSTSTDYWAEVTVVGNTATFSIFGNAEFSGSPLWTSSVDATGLNLGAAPILQADNIDGNGDRAVLRIAEIHYTDLSANDPTYGAWSAEQIVQSTQQGSVTFAGSGTLATSGDIIRQGQITYSGAGAFTASGIVSKPGSISLSGAATFTSSGAVSKPGSVSLSGVATFGAAGDIIRQGQIAYSGAAAFSASGTIAGSAQQGSVSVSGAAAFSAAGTAIRQGSAAYTGNATMTAAGLRTLVGAFSVPGTSNLAASGAIPGASGLLVNDPTLESITLQMTLERAP